MIRNLLFICLTFFSFYLSSQGFEATYGFADVSTATGTLDPGTPPTVSGLTFGPFSAAGTSANPSASGRFSFTGWPLGGINNSDDYSNFTGALSPTVYYEVTLTPDPGYTLQLTSVSFSVRRSGTGIRSYCVRSDVDNYTNNLAASVGTSTRLTVLPGEEFFWNFDSVSTSSDQKGSLLNLYGPFSALTLPVTFRFFAWNAEVAGGSFSIDNVAFTGSVTAPNPVGIPGSIPKSGETRIYKDPGSSGKFRIESPSCCYNVEVISQSGAILLTRQAGTEADLTLDLTGLENGLYFIRVTSPKQVVTKKIALSRE